MRKEKSFIIDNLLYSEVNNINSSFRLKLRNMTEDYANRGLYHSGVFVSDQLSILSEKVMLGCNNTITNIYNYQNLWNRKFNNREIDIISKKMATSFISLIDSLLTNLVNPTENLQSTIELSANNLRQNLNNTIKTKFEEIKNHNKLYRESASIRQIWWSIGVAALSLIVSIIALLKN